MDAGRRKPTARLRAGAAAAAVSILVACSPTFSNHGYVPTDEDLALITVGVDTQETVAALIGRPSSAGILAASGYYYVASRRRNLGIRQNQIVDREVVAISFDEGGTVANVERFGLERGRVVPLSSPRDRIERPGHRVPASALRQPRQLQPGRLLRRRRRRRLSVRPRARTRVRPR